MSFPEARKQLLKSVTVVSVCQSCLATLLTMAILQAPALGFVPVAVHFQLFDCLQAIGKPATAQEVYDIHIIKHGTTTKLCMLTHQRPKILVSGH